MTTFNFSQAIGCRLQSNSCWSPNTPRMPISTLATRSHNPGRYSQEIGGRNVWQGTAHWQGSTSIPLAPQFFAKLCSEWFQEGMERTMSGSPWGRREAPGFLRGGGDLLLKGCDVGQGDEHSIWSVSSLPLKMQSNKQSPDLNIWQRLCLAQLSRGNPIDCN